MDYNNLSKPYESSQKSCSQCTNNCTNKLCDCKGIICLNGAKLNHGTRLCDCITEVKTYDASTCDLQCEANGDDAKCGTKYQKSTCRSSFDTMFHCPWMCDICPYAGKNYTERSEPLPWEQNRIECPQPTTTPTTDKSQKQTRKTNQGAVTGAQSTQSTKQGGNGCSRINVAQWATVLIFLQTILSILK